MGVCGCRQKTPPCFTLWSLSTGLSIRELSSLASPRAARAERQIRQDPTLGARWQVRRGPSLRARWQVRRSLSLDMMPSPMTSRAGRVGVSGACLDVGRTRLHQPIICGSAIAADATEHLLAAIWAGAARRCGAFTFASRRIKGYC